MPVILSRDGSEADPQGHRADWLDGAPDQAGLLCRRYPELMVCERTGERVGCGAMSWLSERKARYGREIRASLTYKFFYYEFCLGGQISLRGLRFCHS
jgi:hypothetical protein